MSGYNIYLDCQSGTNNYYDNPPRWEKNYHVIKWCHVDTQIEAEQTCLALQDNPTCRRAWYERGEWREYAENR